MPGPKNSIGFPPDACISAAMAKFVLRCAAEEYRPDNAARIIASADPARFNLTTMERVAGLGPAGCPITDDEGVIFWDNRAACTALTGLIKTLRRRRNSASMRAIC